MMTGVPMIHVPYRGGAPAVTDLLSGQVQVVFGTITTSSEHIRAGKLRALAVTTATRSDVLSPRCRPWLSSCRATRRAIRMESPRPRILLLKSSIGLTRRSMRGSRSPRSRRGWPTLAAWCWPARLTTLVRSSPTKPRSGPKSSAQPTSSRSEWGRIFHKARSATPS